LQIGRVGQLVVRAGLPYRLQRQQYGIALEQNSPLREKINLVWLQKVREKPWPDKLSQYLGE
jgi:hypothetical protein